MRSWTVWSAVSTMNCPLRSRNLGRGRGLVILAIGGLVQLPAEHTRSITWLKTGDLTDSYITDIPEGISQLALEKTSVRLNESGSVLMAMYGATIGKLGILTYSATTNQACCACKPVYGVETLFLFYFLMSQRTAFIKRGEGGAQPNISKEKIVTTLMPLPPLAEQHRIVQRIEELLPLVKGL